MGYIRNIISEEEKLMRALIECYKQQLLSLPKGALQKRKRGKNTYYYLSYRQGDKVITDYVGKNERQIYLLKERLQQRKHVEDVLRKLNKELFFALRFLENEK